MDQNKVNNNLPEGARRGSNPSQTSATKQVSLAIGTQVQIFLDTKMIEENNLTEEEIAKRFSLDQNDITYDQINDICVTGITFKRPEQMEDWKSPTFDP